MIYLRRAKVHKSRAVNSEPPTTHQSQIIANTFKIRRRRTWAESNGREPVPLSEAAAKSDTISETAALFATWTVAPLPNRERSRLICSWCCRAVVIVMRIFLSIDYRHISQNAVMNSHRTRTNTPFWSRSRAFDMKISEMTWNRFLQARHTCVLVRMVWLDGNFPRKPSKRRILPVCIRLFAVWFLPQSAWLFVVLCVCVFVPCTIHTLACIPCIVSE